MWTSCNTYIVSEHWLINIKRGRKQDEKHLSLKAPDNKKHLSLKAPDNKKHLSLKATENTYHLKQLKTPIT